MHVAPTIAEGDSADRSEVMRTLLSWCVYVTKEQQLAHVVLCCSDVFCLNQLDQFRVREIYKEKEREWRARQRERERERER